MSDDEQQDIRRFGRKDRKRHLDISRPLFDEDEDKGTDDDATEDDSDEDNIGDTAALDNVEVPSISVAAVIAKEHNPKYVSPPEDRFPPLSAPPVPKPPRKQVAPEPSTDAPRKRRYGNWRHDLIAIVFFVATFGMCGYFAILWNNPYSSLNFLPPATPFVVITETPDPTRVAAFSATQTAVSLPTETPFPTQTPFAPTATPTPETLAPPFALTGDVIYAPNENGQECDWASIAGTVTGLDGEPINNYGIQITDVEDPERLDERVFSGAALTFGEGGFELNLGNAPRLAQYEVQLFSPAGVPVSDVAYVVTSDQCDQNVAIINFVQTRPM